MSGARAAVVFTGVALLPIFAALPPVQAAARHFITSLQAAQQSSFSDWLAALRAEALAKGIHAATLDEALGNLEPDPDVLAHDRAQPELTQSLDDYVAARLNPTTLATAVEMSHRYRTLLRRIQTAYGVPGPVMVAIWGLESKFGQITGSRPVVAALATLAYDSRRPGLFRGELFQALTILDRGLVKTSDLVGSWAGAIGQPQFMPSSFLKYAVDFDKDGRIDIWNSPADVLGSMANYLKLAGWTAGERWGREVRVSEAAMTRIEKDIPMRTSGCRALQNMTVARPLGEWRRLGVRLVGGGRLPASAMKASLVRGEKRDFLVYGNYEALIDYNCSNAYAVSVGLLSDQLW
jgi:peptidoglycan lytic transglycosylase B